MKTLGELAMEYALIDLNIPDRPLGAFDRGPYANDHEVKTQHLHYEMSQRFGVYQTQEAIKQAKETLLMVVPDEGPD